MSTLAIVYEPIPDIVPRDRTTEGTAPSRFRSSCGPPLRELTITFERPAGARVAGEVDRRG